MLRPVSWGTIISGSRELAVCTGLGFQLKPPLSDQIPASFQLLAWIIVVISAAAQLITNTNTFTQWLHAAYCRTFMKHPTILFLTCSDSRSWSDKAASKLKMCVSDCVAANPFEVLSWCACVFVLWGSTSLRIQARVETDNCFHCCLIFQLLFSLKYSQNPNWLLQLVSPLNPKPSLIYAWCICEVTPSIFIWPNSGITTSASIMWHQWAWKDCGRDSCKSVDTFFCISELPQNDMFLIRNSSIQSDNIWKV